MTPEDKEAADKAAAEKKAKEDKEAADKAAKSSKKKKVEDLKSTDTVVVRFKNPVHVTEDDVNSTSKEEIEQHVKYEFWLSLAKDSKGQPKYTTLRGAKLVAYVNEDGEEVKF